MSSQESLENSPVRKVKITLSVKVRTMYIQPLVYTMKIEADPSNINPQMIDAMNSRIGSTITLKSPPQTT
jgi:hypothetical protein